MTHSIKTAILTLALTMSANVFAVPEMSCVATHPEMDMSFYGEGVKFVGVKKAVNACRDAAEEESLDGAMCEVSCEPVIGF